MISLVVASVMSVGLWQDSSRDWEFRAGRWAQVAQALSKELGKPVVLNETIKNEIVIGRFVGKTPEEMSSAFAKSTMTIWTEENGSIVIRPDGRSRELREREEKKKREELLVKSIKRSLEVELTPEILDQSIKIAQEVQQRYSETEDYDYRSIMKIERISPGQRLAFRFLQAFSADVLAFNNNDPIRLVYSNTPTKYQRSMGQFGDRLIQEAIAGAKMIRDALDRNGVPEAQSGLYISLLNRNESMAEIVRVRGSISIQQMYITAVVEFFDKDGNQVMMGNASVTEYVDEEAIEFGPDGQPKFREGPYAHLKSVVKLDPVDGMFMLSGVFGQRAQNKVKMSAEERLASLKELAQIMEVDPLSRTVTDVMFTLSRETGKDVSGNIGDRWIMPVLGNEEAKTERPITDYLLWWGLDRTPTHTDTGKEIILSESSRVFQLLAFDRPVLSMLAKEALTKGSVSFDLMANAAMASESEASFTSALHFIKSLTSGRSRYLNMGPQNGITQNDYQALRIYASLPADIKAQVKKGPVRVPVSRLTMKGQELLLNALTVEPNGVQTVGQWRRSGAPSEEEQKVYQQLFKLYKENLQEPTYFLAQADALPVILEVSIGKTVDTIAKMSGPYGMSNGSLEEMAQHTALAEAAAAQGKNEEYLRPYEGYAQFESDQLSIKVSMGQFWTKTIVSKISTDQTDSFVSLDKMPAEFQKAFAIELEKARKMYEGVTFGGSGRGRVIPPR